jgi:hypothetical protein
VILIVSKNTIKFTGAYNITKDCKTCPCASIIKHYAMKTYGGVEV